MNEREWEIRWSDPSSADVPAIDADHRQFVARVNALNGASVECKRKPAIERPLDLMLIVRQL